LNYLQIHELHDDTCLRLRLSGELDIGSVPAIRSRVEELRADKLPVRLDLSRLTFMDSSGVHFLVTTFDQARSDGWDFEVDPTLTPQVERLFALTNVRFLVGSFAMDAN
jgi:anti-anti-sigma factor